MHRSVAVLEEHSSSSANLTGFFADSPQTVEDRYYQKSFEYWVGGFHVKERFHGWNKSQYEGRFTECFVFKNVSDAVRIYGFLCRPKSDEPNYEMCVLVHSAKKKKWKTETAELQRARNLKDDSDVLEALNDPNLIKQGKGRLR